ncbi:MAG: microviridin/marinostatin family tricyclic proteinase inhibitor [Brasilonema octagenarum HA4186-MV1]|jgi:hypothetical protein|uniref:Serine endopeptidase inhibitor n=2 Tax=Brasilonema TaxID=383614 RepID=A0A856MFC5_9CYAN|nr:MULTISPECIES: microviridin/marinostatin family tricyclic proteinase inhibitor [Brasilonema]MBW4626663.1 microviridin/marinostatin family tricyclic proteinase inhibitor [Brasilonema octagenarum HA4186-MV1]NMF63714.1 serine endopeptidase inhibitor [Brasilonema octagenarum UFV-OR1]QDL07666.1 serine endopeptidase inhibitor [Brasilonema sennae CENA114]QDL14028.1 serine endopeptidase inhibitor [Brasilonema octagenarum UFV-E1]
MSDNDQQALNDKAVPFFARYLEGQFCEDLSEEEMETVHGGLTAVSAPAKDEIATTLKYPSDNEDGGGFTKKYPSDKDDVGGGGFTKKYPSDSDEAMTQKYPSDGDDQIIAIDTVK